MTASEATLRALLNIDRGVLALAAQRVSAHAESSTSAACQSLASLATSASIEERTGLPRTDFGILARRFLEDLKNPYDGEVTVNPCCEIPMDAPGHVDAAEDELGRCLEASMEDLLTYLGFSHEAPELKGHTSELIIRSFAEARMGVGGSDA